MNAPWGGTHGRIMYVLASYAIALALVLAAGSGVAETIALSVPMSFGCYFAMRRPVSLTSLVAFAATMISAVIIAHSY